MSSGPGELLLELATTPEELGRALEDLRRFCAERGVPEEAAADLCLAADEVVANVIAHGHGGDPGGRIWMALRVADGGLALEVRDRAAPFDPLAAPPAALGEERDQGCIGGLGIHLVRSVMDGVEYARVGDENRLTLRRRLPAAEPGAGKEPG